ncbi:MFS transporter [Pelomonas sp. KK5]|uniref:MFS transporter n=1 Tax=Pelomonas sp. KK5 TaxID=1855730 RepID=UPI0009FAE426|nr:MFS transporter [Pelomonas sp. KK5]
MSTSPSGSPKRLSWPLLVLFALPTLPMYLLRGPAFSILPALYSERFSISLGTMAAVLLLVRVFDGALDVGIGWATDATRHRWGGRKSWFLAGSLLTVACIFQLYVPPANADAMYFALWFFIAYFAWTVNEIPYGAWSVELTTDYRERSRITVARQYFNVASGALLGLIPLLWFLPTSDMNFDALRVLAWMVALTLPPISVLCVICVPAGVHGPRTQRHSLVDSFKAIRANKAFIRFLVASGLAGLGDAVGAAVGFLVLDSYLGLGAAIGMVLLQWGVSAMIGVGVAEFLLKRFEKHKVFAGSAFGCALCYMGFAPLQPDTPHVLVLYLLCSFAHTMFYIVIDMLPQAMVGDLADFDLMKSGVQRNAQYVSVLTFVRKATFGIGTSLSLLVVSQFGFEAKGAPYATAAIVGLKISAFAMPFCFFMLAALVIWAFPITARRHAVIQQRNARLGRAIVESRLAA